MRQKFNFWRRGTKSLFFVALVFILFNFGVCQAMQIIQIQPAKVRLSIVPGNTQTGLLKVYNYTNDTKYIKVYAEDWVYLAACDGTKEFKRAGSTELSAADWISFSPVEFEISAYGMQLINYSVRVPPDTKGGHYAVLFFEDKMGGKKEEIKGVSVSLAIRVGVLFYLESQGTVERTARIEDLQISKKEDKFNLQLKFTNTGNVDLTTKSNFYIMDNKGMIYARGEFADVYTFPGNSTNLVAGWKEIIPKGKYDLVLSVDIGKALEEARMGRGPVITKETEIEIGENGEVIKVGEIN